MKKDNSLTKSEFQVMEALWSLPNQKGFIPDIIKAYPDPKPAYTTMSTFLKILKEKGYVKSEVLGKMLYYTALVKRDDYTRTYMTEVKNKFFGGNVGVAGLVTATDIIAQCEGKLTSGTLGVPAVMLREEKDTFLDDITTDQLAQRLGVKVEVLPTSGGDEARALLRSGLHIARRRKSGS